MKTVDVFVQDVLADLRSACVALLAFEQLRLPLDGQFGMIRSPARSAFATTELVQYLSLFQLDQHAAPPWTSESCS